MPGNEKIQIELNNAYKALLDTELLLVTANEELAFQADEKAKRASELVTANIELAYQNVEKAKRAAELVIAEEKIALYASQLDFLEFATDGIHILDMQGNLLQCSESFATILGYTRAELKSFNISNWDTGLTKEQASETIAELVKAPKTFDTIHRRKDGTLIYAQIHARVVQIDGINCIYASSRDITQQKLERTQCESAQADALSIENLPPNVAALLPLPPSASSRARFYVVADNSPALIWTAGTDGLCNWFNKEWLEFTGRTMAQ